MVSLLFYTHAQRHYFIHCIVVWCKKSSLILWILYWTFSDKKCVLQTRSCFNCKLLWIIASAEWINVNVLRSNLSRPLVLSRLTKARDVTVWTFSNHDYSDQNYHCYQYYHGIVKMCGKVQKVQIGKSLPSLIFKNQQITNKITFCCIITKTITLPMITWLKTVNSMFKYLMLMFK